MPRASASSLPTDFARRRWLAGALGLAGTTVAPGVARAATAPERQGGPAPLLSRVIASSGERLPVVGLGTWITFNVGRDPVLRTESVRVMQAFFEDGGTLIDSSPMYGSSPEVVGHGLARLNAHDRVFSADKVWIGTAARGPAQVEASRRDWGVPRFDLLQVHNLLAWEAHLPMLREMKAAQRLRYVGVTTSHGRRHDDLERLLAREAIDFVQLTYNPVDRAAERRLLPLAAERGVAVIVNRPFQQGALVDRLERQPLPAWAAEIGATSWAQLVLKFIVSHPAVTCVIPATTQVAHVRENLAAARDPLPDAAMRQRIAAHIASL